VSIVPDAVELTTLSISYTQPQAMSDHTVDQHWSAIHDPDVPPLTRDVQRQHLFTARRNSADHRQFVLFLVVSFDHDVTTDA
jgi:hypothetical protein